MNNLHSGRNHTERKKTLLRNTGRKTFEERSYREVNETVRGVPIVVKMELKSQILKDMETP